MCGLRSLSSVDPVLERVRSVSGISLCCLRARTGSEAGRASGVKLYYSPLMSSFDLRNLNSSGTPSRGISTHGRFEPWEVVGEQRERKRYDMNVE